MPLLGAPPETVAFEPVAITNDALYIYFAETSGDLWRYEKSATSHLRLSTSAASTSIAVDGYFVYWPAGSSIDFVPTGGGTTYAQALPTGTQANEVVTNGVSVYVAHTTGTLGFPSGGGAVTALATNENAPHSLAVSNSVLYRADAASELRRIKTDGSGLSTRFDGRRCERSHDRCHLRLLDDLHGRPRDHPAIGF